jgi:hypothetical protein
MVEAMKPTIMKETQSTNLAMMFRFAVTSRWCVIACIGRWGKEEKEGQGGGGAGERGGGREEEEEERKLIHNRDGRSAWAITLPLRLLTVRRKGDLVLFFYGLHFSWLLFLPTTHTSYSSASRLAPMTGDREEEEEGGGGGAQRMNERSGVLRC